MVVEVIFLPPLATELPRKLCVVIDVLRATSTLVSMFDAGVRRIVLAGSIQGALDLAASMTPRPLVCGESGGLPPAGFDRGNSPREYAPESLDGDELVFFTSNGTKAMRQLGDSPLVMTGSMLNASAAMRAALREARARGLDITLVCSGDFLGTRFAIDDAFCAGFLCSVLRRETARLGVGDLVMDETALAAMRLCQSYVPWTRNDAGDSVPSREAILEAFWDSHNAQVLGQVGLPEDVDYCSQVDISGTVPLLAREVDVLALYPEPGGV